MSVWHLHHDLAARRAAQQEAMFKYLNDQRAQEAGVPGRGKGETMLERLKRFTRPDGEQDRAAVDEMMELAAFGRSLAAEYAAQEIPAPKWLQETLSALSRQIKARHRAALEGELRKAQKELEELKSREEKKAEKEAEIERLRKALEG